MSVYDNTSLQQKSRLFRVATLAAGIFVHLMVCWTVWSLGYLDIGPVQLLALSSLALAGFMLIGLLIGIEWNLTLVDPNMAIPQMIWALTIVVASAHFATELKAVVLFAGLAMVLLGANRLSGAQHLIISGYGVSVYFLSALVLTNTDSTVWVTELLLLLTFGLVLVFSPALYGFERNAFEEVITGKNEELGRALEQIKEMAVRDELTGLFNRRHLLDVLAHEKALADRKKYAFSVCYVDLDFFKSVNDRFGHAAGDEVLKSFATVALEILREVDCVARVGGEEFVLVLSGTNEKDAVRGAERIAEGLRSMVVTRADPGFRITASMGITEYRQDDSIQQLLDRADRALYEAKNTGRNRIVVAGEESAAASRNSSGLS